VLVTGGNWLPPQGGYRMACYTYYCKKCGDVFEVHSSMADFKEKRKCRCGGVARHSTALDHKEGNADSQMKPYNFEGDRGTRLYPCAILPTKDAIAEFKQKCPNTDLKEWNGCLIPVARNRRDKLNILSRLKFEEKD